MANASTKTTLQGALDNANQTFIGAMEDQNKAQTAFDVAVQAETAATTKLEAAK